MIKIILVIFFSSLTFASVFTLTNAEKKTIKSMANKKQVARRFSNFYKFIKEARNYDLEKKLIRTNFHINRIISKGDGKETNSWSTPKEFLINGYGDCEDYAITKYFALQQLGIDKNKLFLSVVKVNGAVNYHMVLFYLDKDNKPLILDNLSWKILPLEKRKNLVFQYAFNDKYSFVFEDGILVKEKNIFGKDIKREEITLLKKMLEI